MLVFVWSKTPKTHVWCFVKPQKTQIILKNTKMCVWKTPKMDFGVFLKTLKTLNFFCVVLSSSIGNPFAYELQLLGGFCASQLVTKIGRNVFPVIRAISPKWLLEIFICHLPATSCSFIGNFRENFSAANRFIQRWIGRWLVLDRVCWTKVCADSHLWCHFILFVCTTVC